MANLFNEDFQDCIRTLNNNSVKYILVGGYAVIPVDILEAPLIWIYGQIKQK